MFSVKLSWTGLAGSRQLHGHVHAAAAAVVAASALPSSTASLELGHISDVQMQKEMTAIVDHTHAKKQFGLHFRTPISESTATTSLTCSLSLAYDSCAFLAILSGFYEHIMGMKTGLGHDLKPTAAAIADALAFGLGLNRNRKDNRKRPGPKPAAKPLRSRKASRNVGEIQQP